MSNTEDEPSNASRRAAMVSGAALIGSAILGNSSANAQSGTTPAAPTPASAPTTAGPMPPGYNILFVLVDQEHFFPTWPFPVPAREAIKKKAVTFLNHQAASCVCSSARSVVYTGQHVQHTGITDNLNYIWQRDLATSIKTVGHRLGDLGYHAAYQGKWHLSANLDLTDKAIDAPLRAYRETIASYGFNDFFGVGDLIDGTLGGYSYDDTTLASAITWLRTEAGDPADAGPALVPGRELRQSARRDVLQLRPADAERPERQPCDADRAGARRRDLPRDVGQPSAAGQPAPVVRQPRPPCRPEALPADSRPDGGPVAGRRSPLERLARLLLQRHTRLRSQGRPAARSPRQQRHGQEHHRDLFRRSRRTGRPSPDARQRARTPIGSRTICR